MIPLKTLLGTAAVVLTFVGFLPYIRDVIKGKTVPHVYSWILGVFATFTIFALQITSGAGAGAYATLAVAVLCTTVLVLSLRTKGKRDIVLTDTISFVFAIVALFLWIFAKQPVLSAILITLTDFLGFIPTIRKTWKRPHTETLSFYLITTVRYLFVVCALEQYNIVTALYPFTWLVANVLFAVMIVVRRKQVDS